MRLLLDENISRGLFQYLQLLPGHDVVHAQRLGWAGITNGMLIARAEEAGFDVLVTADKRIRYQQNLIAREIGLVVLSTPTWPVQRQHLERIRQAIDRAGPRCFLDVGLPRPGLVRRPPPA